MLNKPLSVDPEVPNAAIQHMLGSSSGLEKHYAYRVLTERAFARPNQPK